jgi:hypothetical protein
MAKAKKTAAGASRAPVADAGEQLLLTRPETAALCRVSLTAFDAHVRMHLAERKIGRRVFYLRSSVLEWLEAEPAAAPEVMTRKPVARAAALSSVVNMNDPRIQANLQRMRARRAAREGGANG